MHALRLSLVLTLACAACDGPSPEAAGPARNAVLITLDTTRADALSLYGFPGPSTPNIDALAAEGITYEHARAVTPITLPSHASMLTGLYPLRHGVRANGFGRLPDQAQTLAERARDAGFTTAAFVAASVLDRRFGLDQGFEVYDQVERTGVEHSTVMASRPGAQVVDAALAWIQGRDRSKRFLLWVHLFDPHAPYEPPQHFLAASGGNLYVGEVAYADYEVGRLLSGLRAAGDLEGTTVVLAADHGEDMFEHGEPTHAVYCYDSALRVPLVVRRHDGARAGERSDETVSIADVAPTLVEALGLAALDDVDGLSLWSDAVAPDRGVYFESYYGFLFYGWSPIAGWADAQGKYLHGPVPELYDTRTDPQERIDLIERFAPRAEAYRARIAELSARPRLTPGEELVLDEAALRELSQLGYAGGARTKEDLPDPLDASKRPAPNERLGELVNLLAATRASDEGRLEEAVELLRPIVLQNPRNVAAHDELGKCLGRLERWPEALDVLQRLLALDDTRPAVHINLAVAYEATGRPDPGLVHARRGVEIDPEHVLGRINLVRLLTKQGHLEEAAEVRRTLED